MDDDFMIDIEELSDAIYTYLSEIDTPCLKEEAESWFSDFLSWLDMRIWGRE